MAARELLLCVWGEWLVGLEVLWMLRLKKFKCQELVEWMDGGCPSPAILQLVII